MVFSIIKVPFALSSLKVIKGQILTDFLADHPCVYISSDVENGIEIGYISLDPWTLQFDGSITEESVGVRIVIISPFGKKTHFLLN